MSKKPENKDELDIQELLKNSGVEFMLDLNKLIGKIKKHFIKSTLDAEFDEYIGYQKHDQNSRNISNNYRKGKTKKIIWTYSGKIDIQVRVKDFLLTCCDNLKGISEALKASFQNVHIQKCVILQIKNSTKHVSPKDVASFTSDMKKIYKSPSYDAAFKAIDYFGKSWGEKYPHAIKSWKNNFDELVTFFDYPIEIRKMIYTTNTIENLNRNIRNITKTKGTFISTQSLSKIIYMCLINIQDDYDSRVVHNWPQISNQLTILFLDRLCDINSCYQAI